MFLKCLMYQCFVWLGLVPNCLQRLSADDTKRQELIFHSTLLISCCFSAFLWFSTHLSLFYSLLILYSAIFLILIFLFVFPAAALLSCLYCSFPAVSFSFRSSLHFFSLLYPAAALSSYPLYYSSSSASFSSRSPLHFFPFYTLLLLCHLIPSTVLSQLLLSPLVPL